MGQSRGLWGGYASKVCEVQVFLEGLEFVCVCVCVCVSPVTGGSCKTPISESSWRYRGTTGQGLAGLGRGREGVEHRHCLNHIFLLAGVDTTSGPPHPLVPTGRVLLVLQKGA